MVKMPTLTTKDAVAVGADALNNRRTRCVPCLIAADMCSTSSQFSTLLIYCFSARVAIPVDEDIHVAEIESEKTTHKMLFRFLL